MQNTTIFGTQSTTLNLGFKLKLVLCIFLLNFYSITKSIAQVTVNTQATTYKTITQSNSEYDNKTINTSLAVGAIEGKFEVSLTGGASYRVKPDLPPGIKAMMPNIEVMYSSQAGNTILGASWVLSGLSSITRTGKDHFHDGKIEDFKFTGDDYFSLDGNILVPYGAAGQYRTLKETYNVVTINWNFNGYSDCPNSFTVQTKDGWIMEYGATADAKLLTKSGKNGNSQPNVLTWKVNKITDKHGNYILFKYKNIAPTATSTPTHVIDEISYTHNDALSTAVINYVKFKYSVRQDINSGYIQGDEYLENYVLTAIESYSGTTLYGKLVMDYSYDHNSSVINSIRKFNKANEELNKTSFKYSEFNLESKLVTTSPNTSSNENHYARKYADFNGDGFTDFITTHSYLNPSDNEVYINKNEIFLNNKSGGFILNKTITNVNQLSKVSINNSFNYTNANLTSHSNLVFDYNGDNIQDIIFFKIINNAQKVIEYYTLNWDNNTNTFIESSHNMIYPSVTSLFPNYVPYSTINSLYNQKSQDIEVVPYGSNWIMMGDYNGDGKTEVLLTLNFYLNEVWEHSSFQGQFEYVNLSTIIPFFLDLNSVSTTVSKVNIPPKFTTETLTHIDLNGDGIQEVFDINDKTIYEYNYTTKSFILKKSNLSIPTINTQSIDFGDFNGDKKTDMVFYENTLHDNVQNNSTTYNMNKDYGIYYSNGLDFNSPVQNLNFSPVTVDWTDCNLGTEDPNGNQIIEKININRKLIISDFNFDGKSDIIELVVVPKCVEIAQFYPQIEYDYYQKINFSNGKNFNSQPITLNNGNIGEIIRNAGDLKFGDFNGDGYVDICNLLIGFSFENIIVTNPNQNTAYNISKQLQGIKNGYNNEIKIETKPLTHFNYTNTYRPNTYPQAYNFKFPLRIVTSYNSNDGVGGMTNTINYFYKNLIFDFHSGFKGFEEVVQQNSILNGFTRITNIYNKKYNTLYVSKQETGKDYNNNEELFQTVNSTYVFNDYSNTSSGIGALRYIDLNTYISNFNHKINSTTFTEYNYDTKNNEFKLLSTITNKHNGLQIEQVNYNNYIAAGSIFANKPQEIVKTYTRAGKPAISNETRFVYNTTTGETEEELLNFGKPCQLKKGYEYDLVGNIWRTTSTSTGLTSTPRVEKVDYDVSKRFVEKTYNLMGNLTNTTLYESTTGLPYKSTDMNGLITDYEYDNWNKLKKTTIPSKSLVSTINFNWNTANGLLYDQVLNSTGKPTVTKRHDNLGRERERSSIGRFNKPTHYFVNYDANGLKTEESNEYYTNETPFVSTILYDDYGRPTQSSNPNGTSSFVYSNTTGNSIVEYTNPQGQVKTNYTDASGKNYKIIDIHGNEILHEYNSLGQTLNTKVKGKVSVDYLYNSCQQLEKQHDVSNGDLIYSYDDWGQVVSKTNARKQTESYEYDQYGRKYKQINPEGVTTYSYVPAANPGRYQLAKAYTLATNKKNNVLELYTYTADGQIDKHAKTIGDLTMSLDYTYDAQFGHVLNKEYSSGIKLDYIYDNYQNLVQVMSGGNPIYELKNANSWDKATLYKLGNGFISLNGYDQNYPLSRYTPGLVSFIISPFIISPFLVSASSTIQDYQVNFDKPSGNVLDRMYIKTFGGFSPTSLALAESFTYDTKDRLTSNTINGATNNIYYDADELGNIDEKDDVGVYTYDNQGKNQVVEIENPTSAISPATQLASYTSFEQPLEIHENQDKLYLNYGDDQQRIRGIWYKKNTNPYSVNRVRYYFGDMEINITKDPNTSNFDADFIHYVYNHDGHVVSIIKKSWKNYNLTTSLTTEAADVDIIPTAPIFPSTSRTDFYFTYTDHLGSILTVTNDAGMIIHEQNFDPWGRYRDPNTGAFLSSTGAPSWLYRGYTGHEHLDEFTLINMNGRLFDPVVARFLSTDLYISDPENSNAYNRYTYCLNNPLKYSDPDGEHPALIAAMIIGAHMAGMGYMASVIFSNGNFSYNQFASSLIVGAISGAISCGVGDLVKGLYTTVNGIERFTFGRIVVSSLFHGASQTYISAQFSGFTNSDISTGSLGITFLASSISSFVAGGIQDLCGKTSWAKFAQIQASGGIGALTAWVTGGDPLRAYTTGVIISLANHGLHNESGSEEENEEFLDPEKNKSDPIKAKPGTRQFNLTKLLPKVKIGQFISIEDFPGLPPEATTYIKGVEVIASNTFKIIPTFAGSLARLGKVNATISNDIMVISGVKYESLKITLNRKVPTIQQVNWLINNKIYYQENGKMYSKE